MNITMNPFLQKIFDDTVAKRGGNLGGGGNLPPMSMGDTPMGDLPPMPQLPIEEPIPTPTSIPDSVPTSPEIVDELSEAPVIMVDEIYMGIEDKVSALSPVEAIELATKILAMQIQQ